MSTKTEMKFHPLCTLFPLLPEDELQKLGDDIKAKGQKNDILTLNGEIVDGRNRFLACERVGVKPRFHEISKKDKSPAELVESLNLVRRHLTTSQRASIAAELVTSTEGRPKKTSLKKPVTVSDAAKLLNVSKSSVKVAKEIKAKGTDEVRKAVKDGKVKLANAAKVVRLPKKEQSKALFNPVIPPRGGLYAESLKAKKTESGVVAGPKDRLISALYLKWPKEDHDRSVTIGQMVEEFEEIVKKVIG